MSRPWVPEIELPVEDARRLIESQFPALAPASLEELGVGWDNIAFLVNGTVVFRFPRRKAGANLMEHEIEWLGTVAPHLSLPVPAAIYAGWPENGYPYRFGGYRLIEGETACQLDWSAAGRAANAEPLARFLKGLHGVSIDEDARARAPGDALAKAELPGRVAAIRDRIASIGGAFPSLDAGAVVRTAEALSETPLWTAGVCWVHGDFYPRHLVVNQGRRLSGVIDWGDMHLGDRAIDLSIVFTFLPAFARGVFRNEYGPIDAATWDRARFVALYYGAALVHYGIDVGDRAIQRVGEYALDAAMEPDPD